MASWSGAVVPGALLGDDVLLGGVLGVVLGALGPHLDDVAGPVTEFSARPRVPMTV